jgi:hypothetical protein
MVEADVSKVVSGREVLKSLQIGGRSARKGRREEGEAHQNETPSEGSASRKKVCRMGGKGTVEHEEREAIAPPFCAKSQGSRSRQRYPPSHSPSAQSRAYPKLVLETR